MQILCLMTDKDYGLFYFDSLVTVENQSRHLNI